MSFRNTIDPTVGKLRKNAGKNYQELLPTTNTDNSISSVRMFRRNAGKVYTPETSQQIIEVTKPQLMRVGGKPRGSGGAIADNFFGIKIPLFTGSHIKSFSNTGFSLQTSSTLSSFTFCVWIKTTLTREQCFLTRSGWYGGAQQAFPFRSFIGPFGNLYGGLDSGTDFVYDYAIPVTGSGLNDGSWHHVGFVYLANNYFKIYIDGTLIGNYTHSVTIHNNRSDILWHVGQFSYYDGGPTPINFTGDMAYPVWGNGFSDATIVTNAFTIKPF